MRKMFSDKNEQYRNIKRNDRYNYNDNINQFDSIDDSHDIDIRPFNQSMNSNTTLKSLLSPSPNIGIPQNKSQCNSETTEDLEIQQYDNIQHNQRNPNVIQESIEMPIMQKSKDSSIAQSFEYIGQKKQYQENEKISQNDKFQYRESDSIKFKFDNIEDQQTAHISLQRKLILLENRDNTTKLLIGASNKLEELQNMNCAENDNEIILAKPRNKANLTQSLGIYSQLSQARNNLEGGDSSKQTKSITIQSVYQNESNLQNNYNDGKSSIATQKPIMHDPIREEPDAQLKSELKLPNISQYKRHRSILLTGPSNKESMMDLINNYNQTQANKQVFSEQIGVPSHLDLQTICEDDINSLKRKFTGHINQFNEQKAFLNRALEVRYVEPPIYCCRNFNIDDYNMALNKKFKPDREGSDESHENYSDHGNTIQKFKKQRRWRQNNKTYLMNLNKDENEEEYKLKRKSGRQKIPRILEKQTNLQLRNKKTLQKIMPKSSFSAIKNILMISQKLGVEDDNNIKDEHYDSGSEDISDIEDQEYYSRQVAKKFKKTSNTRGYQYNTKFLLSPDSMVRATWDIMLLILICFQAIVLPMKIAFSLQTTEFLYQFEFLIDVMFIIDIGLNFNTGYYTKSQLIMKRSLIARDYLVKWFWVDLVSSMPYIWIFALSQGLNLRAMENPETEMIAGGDGTANSLINDLKDAPQLMKLLKIAKLLKMLKLLRIMKLKRILIKFEEYIVTDSMALIVTFFSITVKIVVTAHYMACLFFYVGKESLDYDYRGWLVSKDLVEESQFNQYVTSMYWAFTTMSAVGYGDITPVTHREKITCLVSMVTSCGIFAYTVNSIGNIVSRFNLIVSTYKERMMYVNRYTIDQGLPKKTRIKIRRYLDYVFESKKELKIDEHEVFKMLSTSLNEQIKIYLRGRILKQIPFTFGFGFDFMAEITTYFEKFTYLTDDFIFVDGDKSSSIIYIIDGKVSMIHKQSHTYICEIKKETHLGQIGVLREKSRSLSAKARDFTEVYLLNKKDFYKISENYISAIQELNKIKKSLAKEDYSILKLKCYFCESNTHIALKCHKYQQNKGNMMKMHLLQMKNSGGWKDAHKEAQNDETPKATTKKAEIQNEEKVILYYNEEEKHDTKHYPSFESEENLNVKTKTIRRIVQQNTNDTILDGNQIMQVLEYPQIIKDIDLEYFVGNSNTFTNFESPDHLKVCSNASKKLDKRLQHFYDDEGIDMNTIDEIRRNSNNSKSKKKQYLSPAKQKEDYSPLIAQTHQAQLTKKQQQSYKKIPAKDSLAKIKEEEKENNSYGESSESYNIHNDNNSSSQVSSKKDDSTSQDYVTKEEIKQQKSLDNTASYKSWNNNKHNEGKSRNINNKETNWQQEYELPASGLLNHSMSDSNGKQESKYHLKKLKNSQQIGIKKVASKSKGVNFQIQEQQQPIMSNKWVSRNQLNYSKNHNISSFDQQNIASQSQAAKSRLSKSSNSKMGSQNRQQTVQESQPQGKPSSKQLNKEASTLLSKSMGPNRSASRKESKLNSKKSEKKSDNSAITNFKEPWREYYRASTNTPNKSKKNLQANNAKYGKKTNKSLDLRKEKMQINKSGQPSPNNSLANNLRKINHESVREPNIVIKSSIIPKSQQQVKQSSQSNNSHEIDRIIAIEKDHDYSSRNNHAELAIFLTSEQNKNYSLNISHEEILTQEQIEDAYNRSNLQQDSQMQEQIPRTDQIDVQMVPMSPLLSHVSRNDNDGQKSELRDIISNTNLESKNSLGLMISQQKEKQFQHEMQIVIEQSSKTLKRSNAKKGFKPNKTIIGPNGTLQNYNRILKKNNNYFNKHLAVEQQEPTVNFYTNQNNKDMSKKQLNSINKLLSDDSEI